MKKLDFLDRLSKNTHLQNFMNIRQMGAEFCVDRRSGRHYEANSHFQQFCEST